MRTITTPAFLNKAVAEEFSPERTVHWMGGVTHGNYLDAIEEIRELMGKNRKEAMNLVVTSAGGTTGIAMSFYDCMRRIYKPRLTTIGSGDVDSSGVIVFLTGTRRLITPNTTMLLHLAGRTFDASRRYTVPDMEAMSKEDKLKDFQYASVIAENSGGRLTVEKVLDMMARNTILTAAEAVEFGIAHAVLE